MLSGMTASVQNELNQFGANLANRADLWREVSAQAFSKAREKFSHKTFNHLNRFLFQCLEDSDVFERWRGLRRVAADASKVQLSLKDATQRCVQEAVAFALYCPGPELSLSFELYSPQVGERQMLFEHLDALNSDDLLILDRGYPAAWLAAVLNQRHIPFCMRVDGLKFKAVRQFRQSGQQEAIVTLKAPNRQDAEDYGCQRTPTQVRLIRLDRPNGRHAILMTSLLDANAYPADEFHALYHARWRIEEAFKRIKHRLKFEQVSGLSWLAAQQDFGAKMVCDNLNALAILAAEQEQENNNPNSPAPSNIDAMPTYKTNRNYAFAVLKRQLPRWLTGHLPDCGQLFAIFRELMLHLVQFVPHRSNPRRKRQKTHLYAAYKSFA